MRHVCGICGLASTRGQVDVDALAAMSATLTHRGPDSFGEYRWYIVIPDNFLQVRLTTQDGREITGARVNEDPFSIQVRDISGRIYSFWKEELKELHKDWGKSPMPSYKDKLTAAETEDLVSYLGSLRGGK